MQNPDELKRELAEKMGELTKSIDHLIKVATETVNSPNYPEDLRNEILDKLPILDFYNDDLKKSKENLEK